MEITIEQLAQKVKDLRDAQKRWQQATQRGSADKKLAWDEKVKKESEIDELAEKILLKPTAQQQPLF